MTQGVSLKAMYLPKIAKKLINAVNQGLLFSRISILEALKFMMLAWNKITQDTIPSCFRIAGISNDNQAAIRND